MKKKKKIFWFPVVLRLRGKIVPPSIMARSKKCFYKNLIFKHNQLWKRTNRSKKKSRSCLPLMSSYFQQLIRKQNLIILGEWWMLHFVLQIIAHTIWPQDCLDISTFFTNCFLKAIVQKMWEFCRILRVYTSLLNL
jgi:hypothetical protein